MRNGDTVAPDGQRQALKGRAAVVFVAVAKLFHCVRFTGFFFTRQADHGGEKSRLAACREGVIGPTPCENRGGGRPPPSPNLPRPKPFCGIPPAGGPSGRWQEGGGDAGVAGAVRGPGQWGGLHGGTGGQGLSKPWRIVGKQCVEAPRWAEEWGGGEGMRAQTGSRSQQLFPGSPDQHVQPAFFLSRQGSWTFRVKGSRQRIVQGPGEGPGECDEGSCRRRWRSGPAPGGGSSSATCWTATTSWGARGRSALGVRVWPLRKSIRMSAHHCVSQKTFQFL